MTARRTEPSGNAAPDPDQLRQLLEEYLGIIEAEHRARASGRPRRSSLLVDADQITDYLGLSEDRPRLPVVEALLATDGIGLVLTPPSALELSRVLTHPKWGERKSDTRSRLAALGTALKVGSIEASYCWQNWPELTPFDLVLRASRSFDNTGRRVGSRATFVDAQNIAAVVSLRSRGMDVQLLSKARAVRDAVSSLTKDDARFRLPYPLLASEEGVLAQVGMCRAENDELSDLADAVRLAIQSLATLNAPALDPRDSAVQQALRVLDHVRALVDRLWMTLRRSTQVWTAEAQLSRQFLGVSAVELTIASFAERLVKALSPQTEGLKRAYDQYVQHAAPPDGVSPAENQPRATAARSQVVILVHGIRTFAGWQPMVKRVLSEIPGTHVVPIRYGYLDALRFWCPIATRGSAITDIRREIQSCRDSHPDANISVIAHSFGTYSIVKILEDNPDFEFHRLVLVGSIIPRSYRWDFVKDRLPNGVVNDYGTRDIWPVLAKSLSWGYGDTGRHGFGRGATVVDRGHNYAHSEFFNEEFVRCYWKPWFERGEIVRSDWPERAPPASWPLAILSVLPLQWLLVSAIAFALAVTAMLVLHRSAAPNVTDSQLANWVAQVQSGQAAEVEAPVRRLHAERAGDNRVTALLARALGAQAKHEEVIELLRDRQDLTRSDRWAAVALGDAWLARPESKTTLKEADAAFRAALKSDPRFYQALAGLARSLAQQGRWKEAGEFAGRAMSEHGEEPGLLLIQAESLAAEKNWNGAKQVIERTIALTGPDEPGRLAFAYQGLGNAEMSLGHLSAAMSAYEESLKRDAANRAVKSNLAVLYRRAEEPRKALALLLEMNATSKDCKDRVDCLVDMAQCHLALNEYNDAVGTAELLRAAANDCADHGQLVSGRQQDASPSEREKINLRNRDKVLQEVGATYLHAGMKQHRDDLLRKAAVDLSDVLRTDDTNWGVRTWYAIALWELKEQAKALAEARRAVQNQPRKASYASHVLASFLLAKKRAAEALAVLDAVPTDGGDGFFRKLYRSTILWHLDRGVEAVATATEAINASTDEYDDVAAFARLDVGDGRTCEITHKNAKAAAYYLRGRIRLDLGDVEGASDDWAEASRRKLVIEGLEADRALAALFRGDHQIAILHSQLAQVGKMRECSLLKTQAIALLKLGSVDEAKALFQRMLRGCEDYGVWNGLAECHMKQGAWEDALDALIFNLGETPINPVSQLIRAECLIRLQRRDEAKQVLDSLAVPSALSGRLETLRRELETP